MRGLGGATQNRLPCPKLPKTTWHMEKTMSYVEKTTSDIEKTTSDLFSPTHNPLKNKTLKVIAKRCAKA